MFLQAKFPHWIAAAMLFAAAPAYGQERDRTDRDDRPGRDDSTVIREKETVRERDGGKVQVNRLSTVLKTKVVIQEDQPAGQIVDVVYNDGGCIDYYVADYDNQFYVIPFTAAVVRPADHVVFIDIAPARFREVQFFSDNSWPDLWAPAFQEQVFTTFGVSATNRRSRTTLRQGTDVDVDIDRRGRGRADVDVDVDARNRGDSRDRDDRPGRDDADRPNPDRDADRPNPDRDHPPAANDPAANDKDNPRRPPAAGTNPPRPGANAPGRNPAPAKPVPRKPVPPKDDPLKGAPEVEPPKLPAPKNP